MQKQPRSLGRSAWSPLAGPGWRPWCMMTPSGPSSASLPLGDHHPAPQKAPPLLCEQLPLYYFQLQRHVCSLAREVGFLCQNSPVGGTLLDSRRFSNFQNCCRIVLTLDFVSSSIKTFPPFITNKKQPRKRYLTQVLSTRSESFLCCGYIPHTSCCCTPQNFPGVLASTGTMDKQGLQVSFLNY